MSYRSLREIPAEATDARYLAYLTYAQSLWQRALPARALLAVDKALLMNLPESAPVYQAHPLPYTAVVFFLREVDRTHFFGNPRIHYQHLADRVRGKDAELRALRAWACWHLTRCCRPELEGDPKHAVHPPSVAEITTALNAQHKRQQEAELLSRLFSEIS